LFDISIFKYSGPENTIKVGILVLLVIKHGKHIFKRCLENRVDLVLSEIAVIESFYINIVLETRLYVAGAWYNSFNLFTSFWFGEQQGRYYKTYI
jgi:hypothetical protein